MKSEMCTKRAVTISPKNFEEFVRRRGITTKLVLGIAITSKGDILLAHLDKHDDRNAIYKVVFDDKTAVPILRVGVISTSNAAMITANPSIREYSGALKILQTITEGLNMASGDEFIAVTPLGTDNVVLFVDWKRNKLVPMKTRTGDSHTCMTGGIIGANSGIVTTGSDVLFFTFDPNNRDFGFRRIATAPYAITWLGHLGESTPIKLANGDHAKIMGLVDNTGDGTDVILCPKNIEGVDADLMVGTHRDDVATGVPWFAMITPDDNGGTVTFHKPTGKKTHPLVQAVMA